MGEIVMAAGRAGRRYSQRGAAAANAARSIRLYRVEGEVLTQAGIQARLAGTALGKGDSAKVRNWIGKQQKKGPLTWDVLRTYQPREASDV